MSKSLTVDGRFHRRNIKTEKFSREGFDELPAIHQIHQSFLPSNFCAIGN